MFEPWVETLYDSLESRPLGFTNHIVFTSSISNTGFFRRSENRIRFDSFLG
jgi:hypothetical protein